MIFFVINLTTLFNFLEIDKKKASYGPFAIEKGETAKKIFFELIVILDIFQPKNHICHININFIFLAVSSLSIAKGPYLKIKNSHICYNNLYYTIK